MDSTLYREARLSHGLEGDSPSGRPAEHALYIVAVVEAAAVNAHRTRARLRTIARAS
jgi:hypothetical protein